MHSKLLTVALLASVTIVPAFAQSERPAANPPAATATAPKAQSAMWRSSKLIGLDVYNEQNEKIGDISEILLDKSGKVEGVVIGVGGFLGIGQRDVKVEMSKLKFVDEPVRSSATERPAGDRPATTGAGDRPAPRASNARSDDRKWYPDHAVLTGAGSKDQVKNMPEFKYD
jgi:sporulation protein YlmC with PRC-barrel domain